MMATLQSGESGDYAAPRVDLVRKLEPVPVPVPLQSTMVHTAWDISTKKSPATIFLAQVITFHLSYNLCWFVKFLVANQTRIG